MLIRGFFDTDRYPREAILVEVSPSGKYLKFRHPSGSESWKRTEDTRLVEVLPTKDAPTVNTSASAPFDPSLFG